MAQVNHFGDFSPKALLTKAERDRFVEFLDLQIKASQDMNQQLTALACDREVIAFIGFDIEIKNLEEMKVFVQALETVESRTCCICKQFIDISTEKSFWLYAEPDDVPERVHESCARRERII